jgi:hypothetical protein
MTDLMTKGNIMRYPEEKICIGCNIQKHKSCFNFQHANPDGLNKHCKDCLEAGIRFKKPRKKRTYDQNRNEQLKKKFGISSSDFDIMLSNQGNGCAICGDENPLPSRGHGTSGFVVDHCHETGIIRAILCGNCNKAIGFMRDDPTTAGKAAEYLKKWMDVRNET